MPQPLQTPLKGITASTLSMLLLLHYLVLHCYSLSYYFLHLWGCCLSFAFSAAKMMVFWRQLAWSFFSFMLSSLNISLSVKISREMISLFILCTLFHWSSPPVKCSTLSRTQCWVKACPSCQVPIYSAKWGSCIFPSVIALLGRGLPTFLSSLKALPEDL